MAVTLTIDDLTPFAPALDEAKANAMIADALALAARVAPCILEVDFEYDEAAKAILRGAILRWNDSGNGAYVQQTAGQFSVVTDNRQGRKSMFWPSEINELAALCGSGATRGAYMVDMIPEDL